MPQVGDQFTFIQDNSNGGERYGRAGERGEVVNGRLGARTFSFRFLDRIRQNGVGFDPTAHTLDVRFDNLGAANEQEVTLYVIYYLSQGSVQVDTRRNIEAANRRILMIEDSGLRVLAKKKIKTRVTWND